ncbi:MAG: hypothetical protein IT517_02445 [Burkholderiales bacterium]|nr:hypothetical protein [Burkholderiales bacterium]
MNVHVASKPLRTMVALALLFCGLTGHVAAGPDGGEPTRDRQPGPDKAVAAARPGAEVLPRPTAAAERATTRGATAADPIAESFSRMLAHPPSAAAPAVPSGMGPDPLTDALVVPLRQRLSASAAGTHVATVRRAAAGN